MTTKECDEILADVEIIKVGGEFLHLAITKKKAQIVSHLIKNGAALALEPDTLSFDKNYRRTPFIITAALAGDVDTFQALVDHGANVKDRGFITLSRKKKNQVITNVIGAAAYGGNLELLQFLISKMSKTDLEFLSKEKQDSQQVG